MPDIAVYQNILYFTKWLNIFHNEVTVWSQIVGRKRAGSLFPQINTRGKLNLTSQFLFESVRVSEQISSIWTKTHHSCNTSDTMISNIHIQFQIFPSEFVFTFWWFYSHLVLFDTIFRSTTGIFTVCKQMRESIVRHCSMCDTRNCSTLTDIRLDWQFLMVEQWHHLAEIEETRKTSCHAVLASRSPIFTFPLVRHSFLTSSVEAAS